MVAILLTTLLGLAAIAQLAFYAFKGNQEVFIFAPAFSAVGRLDHFVDLQVVTLNGSTCPAQMELIYSNSCYFNPTNIPRLFIYIARYLSIGEGSTLWLGFALGSLTVAAVLLVYVLCLKGWRLLLASALALSLYPFQLALERGNIDLIILLILLVSALLAAARPAGILSTVMIGSLFCLASMGKIYPLLLTPLLILHCRELFRGRFSFIAVVAPVLIASSCFALLLPDIHSMLQASYKDAAGGLSYGLATLVEANIIGISLLGMKLIVIALIASTCLFPLDVFGIRSLAAEASKSLASVKTSERLCGTLYIIGSTLFVGTYLVFINGIYRISIPLILILPAIVNALQFGARSVVSATRRPAELPRNSGLSFLMLVIVCIGFAGYRHYGLDSNLQHYTNLYLNLILLPTLVGITASALGLLFLPHGKIDGHRISGICS